MIELTHSKARSLIQVAADRSLASGDHLALNAHLQGCAECRAYANQLASLEASLRQTFRTRWDTQKPDLNLQNIKQPSPARVLLTSLFNQTQVFGKGTVIVALLVGYLVIVNIVGARSPVAEVEMPTILPTPNGLGSNSDTSPTPSIQTALSDLTYPACTTVLYIMKENDTLETIALRNGVTKELILAYNPENENLAANSVYTGMRILIPQCEGTPSRTAMVPGNTMTITPINGTILPDQPE